jgi:hypothetical protein
VKVDPEAGIELTGQDVRAAHLEHLGVTMNQRDEDRLTRFRIEDRSSKP